MSEMWILVLVEWPAESGAFMADDDEEMRAEDIPLEFLAGGDWDEQGFCDHLREKLRATSIEVIGSPELKEEK